MREKQAQKSYLKEIATKRSAVIKSLNCNETMVARLVSEGGWGEGG